MTQIPTPDQTPQGPAYQGRLLDRADEEVVDQGASFDLATLLSRRNVLAVVGLGIGAAVLAACAPASPKPLQTPTRTPSSAPASPPATAGAVIPAAEIPEEIAGPFPGDGSNGPDILERSGIVRRDIRSSIGGGTTAAGVPLTVIFTILDIANGDAPFWNAALYAWQCDAQGNYSMYSDTVQNETYLRGVQVADVNGQVTFTSIVPGCYTGRWPHIHFEVYPELATITDSTAAVATSQLAFPEDMFADVYGLDVYAGSASRLQGITLDLDLVFRDDNAALQMASITGDATIGFTAALTIRVDTRTR